MLNFHLIQTSLIIPSALEHNIYLHTTISMVCGGETSMIHFLALVLA